MNKEAKKEIKRDADKLRSTLIVVDIALIVLGLILALFPGTSTIVICRFVGIAMCIVGLFQIITYFASGAYKVIGSFSLAIGGAVFIFGLYFAIRPEFLASILAVVFSLAIIVGGVMKVQYAFDLAQMGVKGWWCQLILAIVIALLGFITVFNPFASAAILMTFIGIALLIDGLWDLISVIWISKKTKDVIKEIETEYIEQ